MCVCEMAREIGEWPTDVGGDHAEERLRRGGEEADPEFLVKEEGRNVRAVQNVLEVQVAPKLPIYRRITEDDLGPRVTVQA